MPQIYEDKVNQLDLEIEKLFTTLITFPPEHAQTLKARQDLICSCTLQTEQKQVLHHCSRLEMKHIKQQWLERYYVIEHLCRKMENYLDIKRAINQNYSVKPMMDDMQTAREHTMKAVELVNQHCYLNASAFIHHAREIKEHIQKPHIYLKHQLNQAHHFITQRHTSLKNQFKKTFNDSYELPPNMELISIKSENKKNKHKK